MRALDVHLNDQQVGTLTEANDLWQFSYAPAWVVSPGSFDLSPALDRATGLHRDGASVRPVQWYFDNLLPEETLREALIKESGIRGDDAFALLEYLGAESAGSLVLLPPGTAAPSVGGLKPLTDENAEPAHPQPCPAVAQHRRTQTHVDCRRPAQAAGGLARWRLVRARGP